jgi:hypothetical protein
VLILYIIVGLIAGFALILLIPVDFVFRLRTEGEPAASARVEWLFGMAKKEIVRKKKKPAAKKRRQEGIVTRLRRRVVLGLVKRLLRAVEFNRLNGFIRLGLDDPASTGIVYGICQFLLTFASLPPGSDFRVEPDFNELAFRADVEGRVRVIPLQVTGITLGFVFSPEGWHALKQSIRAY